MDDKHKYTDWSKREDIKALKIDLVILLAENDNRLKDRDEVIKKYLSRPRI